MVYGAALGVVVAGVVAGFHQLFEAPVFAVVLWLMESADGAGVALTAARRGAGETSVPMIVAAAAFVLFALAFFLLLRRSPGRRFMSRIALVVPAIVLLVGLNTLGYGGGLALPALLLALGVPTLFMLGAGRYAVGHAFLTQGMVVGAAYLTTSGIAAALGDGGAVHLATQAAHSQVGMLWTPFLLAWTWSHVVRTDGIREDVVRWSGFLALAGLLLVALTGLATLLMAGDSLLAQGAVHGVLGVLAWGLIVWHAVLRPSTSRPSWMGWLVAGGAVCGALLGLRASLFHEDVGATGQPVALVRPTQAPSEISQNPHLDPRWLGSSGETVGCAGFLACHQTQLRGWSSSAHGHSAGSIYSAVAARLVDEEGPAAAALCAGCHDPMPLVTGALTSGSTYPRAEAAHVACGICHSMVATPSPVGGGRYEVRGDPDFAITGRWRSTAYLLVKTHLDTHRRDWKPSILGSDEQCGACHQNELAGVRLVDTFREWQDFVLVDTERRGCVDCHMPRLSDDENGEGTRDHRFISGNISLAGLTRSDREERRLFMADVLGLEVEAARRGANAGVLLTVRLTNIGSGHGFPTQPLDLTFYGFEARVDGGDWTPLHETSLFDKKLLDASGNPLLGHELWKVAAVRGAGRIQPGEHRVWTYPLDAGRAETVDVRLVHQRLRNDFITEAMRAEGVMLDPVVVLEAAVPMSAAHGAAAAVPVSTVRLQVPR